MKNKQTLRQIIHFHVKAQTWARRSDTSCSKMSLSPSS